MKKENNKCPKTFILALNDTLNVINGKWKLHIIAALLHGNRRFMEIGKSIPGINPRMLSKELKDLEANGVVLRMVYNTTPVSIEYELTSSGKAIEPVLDIMVAWGLEHRKEFFGEKAIAEEEHDLYK